MINVRDLLSKESNLNCLLISDDPINNIIYLQDQDITIVHYLLPRMFNLNNSINKENHSYYAVTKAEALLVIDELEKNNINFKICNVDHKKVNVTYTKNFHNKNAYNYFINKAHNKSKTNDDHKHSSIRNLKSSSKLPVKPPENKNIKNPKLTSNIIENSGLKLRIDSNKDLTHLDDLADSHKAIQRTHKKNKPDPEKPTWGDMHAKRFGESFKD